MTPPEWFPGEGRNADDEAFLAELRRRMVTHEGLADVRVEDTGVAIWEGDGGAGWVVAWAGVPGFPEDATVQSQVGFDLSDSRREVLVATWETHGYVLDHGEELADFDPTPAGAAARALDWMAAQLRRPVIRLDWARCWRSDVSEWRLADTDQVLWSDPVFRKPRRAGQPTRLR